MTRSYSRSTSPPDQPALPQLQRAFGYCRVSTDRQADGGISLDEQSRRVRGRALEEGWSLSEIFIDAGVSGSVPLGQRPEGARLLAAITTGDAIVCPKLDRMFRSALDALTVIKDLQRRRISLFLLDLGGDDVSGNGVSRMMLTMLSAFAEFERDRISERIKDSKRQLRATGMHQGGNRPFGWRVVRRGKDEGKLVPDPEEQRALEDIRRMKAEGASLRYIADTLKARGLSISHQSVKRALDRTTETTAGEAA
jgi:DNA invertase Pin-like site-specific DNA recombinase